MISHRSGSGWRLALLFILLMSLSCSQSPLPEAPAFEQLGFADALEAVHRQMQAAYEQWQENPRDADRNGRMGMLLSTYGKNSASEVFYRRARLLAPEEFRWTYYLAVGHQQSGRYAEAIAMFREALRMDPTHVESRIHLAQLLLETNDIAKSIELYRALTVDLPQRVEGWLGLGKALDRSGDLVAATAALQRARMVGPKYGEVHYALAAVLSASGDDTGAASELVAYQNTVKNTIRSPDPLISAVIQLNASDGPFMAKADYQLRRGQYAEAARQFQTALSINPANQDAWGGLIDALAKLGNVEATGASYRAALDAGINYRRLHLTYGQALRKWQQFDAAREVIAKAIEVDPQYTDALVEMGELDMQRGASAAAVEHFRRALSSMPNNRRVMFSLAQALNAAGQFEEAAGQLESLTDDPDLDRALTLKELAVAYYGMKRKNAALETLQRSREVARKAYDSELMETIDALLADWR